MDRITLDDVEYGIEFYNDGDGHAKSINCSLIRYGSEVATAHGRTQLEALTRALIVREFTHGRW